MALISCWQLPLVTVGASVFALGISSAATQAAMLNFSFSSDKATEATERNGSIIFDNSVPDLDSSPTRGFYKGALQSYQFSLFSTVSGEETFSGSGGDIFVFPFSSYYPDSMEIFFQTKEVGFGFVYAPGSWTSDALPTVVASTTIDSSYFTTINPVPTINRVPEPTATFGLLAVGAVGLLWKRRWLNQAAGK